MGQKSPPNFVTKKVFYWPAIRRGTFSILLQNALATNAGHLF